MQQAETAEALRRLGAAALRRAVRRLTWHEHQLAAFLERNVGRSLDE